MSNTTRRCITVPLYLGMAACLPLLIPLLPLVALFDALRGTNWAITRALVFFAVYIGCEALGIVASATLWLVWRLIPSFGESDYLGANFRLQCWWASALYRGAELIFRMTTNVDGEGELGSGPFILFARHVSTADTVLPAVLISVPHGISLRYVLKRELLWDPCLDIVGQRLKNYFVDRHAEDRGGEIEAVARLAEDLSDREGVMIYPEGTRFSTQKLERALANLGENDDAEVGDTLRRLRNVLPPKFGGPLALLARNPATDLVLLGHTGFEGIERLTDLVNGALIGRVINVRFWRFRRDCIPSEAEAMRRWLVGVWESLDQWIESTRKQPALEKLQTSHVCQT